MSPRAPRKPLRSRPTESLRAERILRSAIEQASYDSEIEPYLNAAELHLVARFLAGDRPTRRHEPPIRAFELKLSRWAAGGPFVTAPGVLQRGRLRVLVRERLASRDLEELAREARLTARELAVLRLYALSDRRPRLAAIAAELGLAQGAVKNLVTAILRKFKLRSRAPSRQLRSGAQAPPRRGPPPSIPLKAMTDEQLLAHVAAKRYTSPARFRSANRELYVCVRDRGLLDRLFPERPSASREALRALIERLPEHELELFVQRLDELQRDVLRLRIMADPPATRRWFRWRTDGPRCIRIGKIEKALLRAARLGAFALAAAERDQRLENPLRSAAGPEPRSALALRCRPVTPRPPRPAGPRPESPRALVASLDAAALARLRADLGPAGLAVLEHRLLPQTPLTLVETARRSGLPLETVRDTEDRLTVTALARLGRR